MPTPMVMPNSQYKVVGLCCVQVGLININNTLMLRLSNLLRGRVLPKHIATRSGLPNWDRPDPPPSATVPVDHELTDEQIIFHLPDRNMPEYILTQTEVYEGDTLLEATPMLLKGFSLLVGFAGLMGFVNWITNPPKSYQTPSTEIREKYEQNKKMTEEKQWLKWASLNPLGLVLTNDNYSQIRSEFGNYNRLQRFDEDYQKNEQVMKEVRAYLTGVKQRATEKVNKAGHHGHEHKQAHGEHKSKH